MEKNHTPQSHIIITQETQSNGIGIAGFVLTVLALLLCWVPVLGQILWVLGFVFSFAGLFKKPKGLAIAGFIISLIGLLVFIVLTFVFTGILFLE